ncbi:MAG: hypothetical protein ACLFV7_12815, partial [Phycisphaerae bacterium]
PAPRAHLARPKKNNTAMAVITVLCVLGAVGAAIAAHWFYTHPVVQVYDPATGTYEKRRVSRAEAEQIRKEEEARQARLAERTDQPSPDQAQGGASGGNGLKPDDPKPPEDVYAGGNVGEIKVKGDRDTRITDLRLKFADVGTTGELTARFRNLHVDPVETATVSIVVIDSTGARQGLRTVTVKWVPSNHYVRFSLPFGGLSPDEGYGFEVTVSAERNAEYLCLPVSTRGLGYYIEGEGEDAVIELTGKVRNTSGRYAVLNGSIYCDFYTPHWYHEGFAVGQIEGDGAERLDAGQTGFFRVKYPPKIRFLRTRYEYMPRLIGKKAL